MSDLRALLGFYRQLRRLHRSKLPPPMRDVGDRYLKAEFAAHLRGSTTREQWDAFIIEWQKYADTLRGDLAAPAQSVLDMNLTPEQSHRVSQLYQAAKTARKKLISDILD